MWSNMPPNVTEVTLVNWGMLPFTVAPEEEKDFQIDDFIFIPGIRQAVENSITEIPAWIINSKGNTPLQLKLVNLTPDEREIILAGCLMNYYAKQ